MLDFKPFYINISGYRFIPIKDVETALADIKSFCINIGIKGSILIAQEGINISVAGNVLAVQRFLNHFNQDERFANIRFHETYSRILPFDKSVFKVKAELVPIEDDQLDPHDFKHQQLPATELQRWLDEGREFTLLDMRNDFEYDIGSFKTAQRINLGSFRQLKNKQKELAEIPKDKPIVTFCTGGIRCEKAGPYLETQGFPEVFQLEGGIIEYLRATNAKHWRGNCFVFDDRISINKNLGAEHIKLCFVCQVILEDSDQEYCEKCLVQEASSDVAI